MKYDPEDKGTIAVLMERYTHIRLPRALEIKERVDSGDCLNEFEIEFLHEVFEDSKAMRPLISHHPELLPVVERMAELYHHITEKALENERLQQGKPG